MKYCPTCRVTKVKADFYSNASKKDKLHSECKECSKAKKRAWAEKNKDKAAQYDKEWQVKNKDKKSKNYLNWQQSNRGSVNTFNSKRRAAKLNRTPKWADQERIKAYYDVCAFFNEVNGYIKYHVDHEIPLQGKTVSGLHVHNNLQVILAKDNMEKGNKYGTF